MSNLTRVYDGFVYRSGSTSDVSLTPRPDDDVSGDLQRAGLSTWRSLEAAVKIGKKAQKIDLAKLDAATLGCFEDDQGHVSIVPIDANGHLDMIELTEWAATRGTNVPHLLTRMIYKAVAERNIPEALMSEIRYSEAQWQLLHDEIQRRFHVVADELAIIAPTATPRFNKTVTERFPLFSYVSFHRSNVSEGEYIIVGVDIGPENGEWRIDADICDEEEGTIYFELPRTPFSVANFEELKERAMAMTDELLRGGKRVLINLLGSTTPAVPPGQAVGAAAALK